MLPNFDDAVSAIREAVFAAARTVALRHGLTVISQRAASPRPGCERLLLDVSPDRYMPEEFVRCRRTYRWLAPAYALPLELPGRTFTSDGMKFVFLGAVVNDERQPRSMVFRAVTVGEPRTLMWLSATYVRQLVANAATPRVRKRVSLGLPGAETEGRPFFEEEDL